MSGDLLTRAFRSVRNVTPQPGASRYVVPAGERGVAPAQNMEAQLQAMGAVSTLFAIVDLLASRTAAVGWKLYRKNPTAEPDARQVVNQHPALVVWNKPNPYHTQRGLVETGDQHYELTGESYLWIVRARNGMPMELWPIRPDRIRPVPHPTEHIAGYVYKGKVDVPLAREDILSPLFRPNPTDPYRGISPMGTLSADVTAESSAARWNAAFFGNSARPDGIIEVPDTLTDSEFESLEKHWAESHQGVMNAHRTAILERGSYKSAGYSQKDMDFVSLRGFTAEKIREAYGVSKFMLGEHKDTNRATANATRAEFAASKLVPRLDLIREMLNGPYLRQFYPPGREPDVEFDYDNPVPPDADEQRADLASRIAAAKELIDMGADKAQVLEAFQLPELDFAGTSSKPAPAAGANVRSLAEIGFDPVGAAEAYGITGVAYDPDNALVLEGGSGGDEPEPGPAEA